MAKVKIKVEEYTQYIRWRTIEVDLDEEEIAVIKAHEKALFDLDEEGDGDFINVIADKIDKAKVTELEQHTLIDNGLLAVMRMKILNNEEL